MISSGKTTKKTDKYTDIQIHLLELIMEFGLSIARAQRILLQPACLVMGNRCVRSVSLSEKHSLLDKIRVKEQKDMTGKSKREREAH